MFENVNSTEINDDGIIRYMEKYVSDVVKVKMSNGQEDVAWVLTDALNVINILTHHCFSYGIGIPNQQIAGAIHTEVYKRYNEEYLNEQRKIFERA